MWDPALIFKIFSTIGHPETKRLNIDIQQLIKAFNCYVMTAIKNTRMPKFNLKSSFWLEGEPSDQPNSQNENQTL